MNKNRKLIEFWTKYRVPFVYDDTLSLYQLVLKVIKHLNLMIGDQNELKKAIKEFLLAFDEDLDETVLTILEMWLENGRLDDILARGLLKQEKTYVNVEEVTKDMFIKDGDLIKTKGFYKLNDGGGAYYFAHTERLSDIYIKKGDLYLNHLPQKSFNIKEIGVKPNENISEKLNTALKYCSGKSKLIIDDDYYFGGTPIFIPSNTHIILNGKLTASSDHASIFETFDRVTKTPKYSASQNVVVEGSGVIDMNGGNLLNSTNTVFRIHHANGVTIRGISILNNNRFHAIEIGGSKNVTVDGVKFNGMVVYDDKDNMQETIQIEHISEGGTRFAIPYDETVCENITIKNCLFESSGGGVVNNGVGSHSQTKETHKNIKIINNTFKNIKKSAIIPSNWENTIISGNQVIGGGFSFIYFSTIIEKQLLNSTISNNNIYNMKYTFKPSETIHNHDFVSVINLVNSHSVLVSGNSFNECENMGVRLSNSSAVTITGNHLNVSHSKDLKYSSAIILHHYNELKENNKIIIEGNMVTSKNNMEKPINFWGRNNDVIVRNNIFKKGLSGNHFYNHKNPNLITLFEGQAYSGDFKFNESSLNFDYLIIEYDLGVNVIKDIIHVNGRNISLTDITPANSTNYIRFQRVDVEIKSDGSGMTLKNNTTLQGSLGGEFEKLIKKDNKFVNNHTFIKSIKGYSSNFWGW